MVNYICDYGCSHGQKDVMYKNEIVPKTIYCDCFYKYWPVCRFRTWVKSQFKLQDPFYNEHITEDMRASFLMHHQPYKISKKTGDYFVRKANRNQWLEAKLKELSKEELEAVRNEATSMISTAIAKGFIGKKFLKELSMSLICLKYNCPY